MRTVLRFSVLAVLIAAGGAEAAEKRSTVAGWEVSVEKDPFGSDDRVIAFKLDHSAGIAFRCFSHKPHIAILTGTAFRPGDFTERKFYKVKLRVDDQQIQDAVAIALSNSLVQVETETADIYSQVYSGKELALKFSDEATSIQYSFSLRGASKALAEFWRSCNIKP